VRRRRLNACRRRCSSSARNRQRVGPQQRRRMVAEGARRLSRFARRVWHSRSMQRTTSVIGPHSFAACGAVAIMLKPYAVHHGVAMEVPNDFHVARPRGFALETRLRALVVPQIYPLIDSRPTTARRLATPTVMRWEPALTPSGGARQAHGPGARGGIARPDAAPPLMPPPEPARPLRAGRPRRPPRSLRANPEVPGPPPRPVLSGRVIPEKKCRWRAGIAFK
jgi:hypothetical protein